jgi:hypothetical protein
MSHRRKLIAAGGMFFLALFADSTCSARPIYTLGTAGSINSVSSYSNLDGKLYGAGYYCNAQAQAGNSFTDNNGNCWAKAQATGATGGSSAESLATIGADGQVNRLFWHEVSTRPVPTDDEVSAMGRAETRVTHRIVIPSSVFGESPGSGPPGPVNPGQPDDPPIGESVSVDWSMTCRFQIDFGVVSAVTWAGDQGTPSTVDWMESGALRFDRNSFKSYQYHYEFGVSAPRDSIVYPDDPGFYPLFSFNVYLRDGVGLQMDGDLYLEHPNVEYDPDYEADGIDWITIVGSYIGEFTISDSVVTNSVPDENVNIYFDTYSRLSEMATVPEPSTFATLGMGVVTLLGFLYRRCV